ncbi:50S ribosomal protein L29 [Candidatus Campbellbacteria bacterium CG10_big_fil_rev_8_21_14_0_10_35_52]|uniref:Large ribosomal subunit protein uL29 n=1 Tax=Candidatus Campbellbacteria bacterium CG10_big_fil_rev_8_21_14_0_10_35_52 TaxID=1974527 RepID=A0A2M6WVR5_9BACT|nr:MAG: 50S ribosomal protein L29 [Candidatus Campbellbacteria bacterium CG10_big_fil_rev_8_21_14_0_10_35_52]
MDLKNKTEKELIILINKNREKLRNFKFSIAGSKIRNVKEGRNIRKDIARILTEINIRQKSK